MFLRQPNFILITEQVRTPYPNTNETVPYVQGLKTASVIKTIPALLAN